MLNLKKISQAMLIALGLAVASYYVAPAFAAEIEAITVTAQASDSSHRDRAAAGLLGSVGSLSSADLVKPAAPAPKDDNSAIVAANQDLQKTIAENEARRQNKKMEAALQKLDDQPKAAAAAKKAGEDYDKAVQDYKKQAEEVAKQQKNCQASGDKNSEACQSLKKAQNDLAAAKEVTDKAYHEKNAAAARTNELGSAEDSLGLSVKAKQAAYDEAVQDKTAAEEKIADLNETLKEAKSACEHSKTLTSKQGKADAEKYCGMQEELEQQVAEAEGELMDSEEAVDIAKEELDAAKAEAIANASSDPLGPDFDVYTSGKEYRAFSTAVNQGEGYMSDGTYAGSIDYSNTGAGGDVFNIVTRRAARILVGLKPIVYTFAGFGLIAFAFAAIFNKISWKWFANIAIGLFLVANMGRLIEYMVYTVDDKTALSEQDKIQAFGDYLHQGFADTEYAWVDEMAPYTPPAELQKKGQETPDVAQPVAEEKETKTRGFCKAAQKGGGLFGGGGFSSCVKDLISAGKKAVDTVKKVQNTVDTVKNAAENAKFAAQNIGDAIDKIGKGNLEDSFNALGQIGKNVNYLVGSTGGALNNVMSNVSSVTNNIQDISKSTDQQRELQQKRDRGEATNKIDAALKGQKLDKDGNVERRWAGNIEKDKNGNITVTKSGFDQNGNAAKGDIASNKKNMQNTGQLGFMDVAQDVVKKSGQINNRFQDATQTLGAGASAVGNFSAFGSKTINQGRQERQAAKRAEVAEKAAAKAEAKRAEQAQIKKGEGLIQDATSTNGQTNNSRKDTQAYQNAQAAAEQAEAKATAAERKSSRLEAVAQSTEAEYNRVVKEAEAAAEKAKISGSDYDRKVAEQMAKRVEVKKNDLEGARMAADNAADNAAEARQKAAAAQEPLEGLYKKSLDEGINNAKSEYDNAVKEAEKIRAEAATAQQQLADKLAAKSAADQKRQAAEQAALEAKQALDADPGNKAKQDAYNQAMKQYGAADDAAKSADRDYNATKATADDGERQAKEAELRAQNAKTQQTKLEAERDVGLTQETESRISTQSKKTPQISEQQRMRAGEIGNALNNALNPVTVANRAEQEYKNAQSAAAKAKDEAAKQAKNAQAQRKEADEAMKNAKTSAEKARAESLQSRAKLAEQNAQEVAAKAKEAEKPLAELKQKVTDSGIAASKYQQTVAKQTREEVARNLPQYREAVTSAETAVNEAQQELQQMVEAYEKGDHSKALLLQIATARDAWQRKDKEYRQAQKTLEDEIRRGRQAENTYWEAYANQAQLEAN